MRSDVGPRLAGIFLIITTCLLVLAETPVPESIAMANRATMPDDELQAFVRTWDAAKETSLIEGPGDLIGQVTTTIDFPDKRPRDILKYNNREIVARVTDLYIAEWQRHWRISIENMEFELASETDPGRIRMLETLLSLSRQRLQQSIVRDGKRFLEVHIDEPVRQSGETELDYQDLLASVAESTFSEEIYPYIFATFQVSTIREYYLAYVRPAATLEAFINGSIGEWNGVELYPDFVYLPNAAGYVWVDKALAYLSHMAECNEMFRRTQRDEILRCVEKFVLHYADPGLPTDGTSEPGQPYYSNVGDYTARTAALQILNLIGTSTDVQLVRRITAALPTPKPVSLHQEDLPTVAELGHDVEEALQKR